MKQLVLIEPSQDIKEVTHLLEESFIAVREYFPMNTGNKASIIFYDSVCEAVEKASSILIHVTDSYFDTLLLGDKGILVSIKEGTEILITANLSTEKFKIYDTFLQAKNQKLKYIEL